MTECKSDLPTGNWELPDKKCKLLDLKTQKSVGKTDLSSIILQISVKKWILLDDKGLGIVGKRDF